MERKTRRLINLAVVCLSLTLNCFVGDLGFVHASSDGFLIKNWVAVHGKRVRFDEIAEPVGDWARGKWSELKEVLLWKMSGQKVVIIPRQRLVRDLRYFLGDIVKVCFLPKQIVMKRAASVMGKEDLRREVVVFLTEKVKNIGEEMNLRDFRLPEAIFLQRDESLRIELTSRLKPGRNSLRFLIGDALGNQMRSYSGSVFIDVWKTVPCAARPVNRKEVLGPSLIRFEKKNLAYVQGEIWDGRSGPWRVKSPVGEGQVFVLSNLEAVPVVNQGDRVTLKFQGRFVSLAVPAIVLEDGNLGQFVLVKNLQSKTKVLARVVDKNTVVVN
ncbi:flagellar basal body P-ring formation chaperone FlgA [Desulfovulcanus sp.]